MARRVVGRLRGHRRVRDARPRVLAGTGNEDRRAGPGRLTSWPGDYATFLRRKEEALAVEAAHDAKFDKKLAEEEAWLRQGIKARRTRNEGRVRALLAMREERAARRTLIGSVRLQTEMSDRSGQIVFEAEGISKSFDGRPVVREFSRRE